MSLDDVTSLLHNHRIVPNRLLGQNFFICSSSYPLLSNYANLGAGDVVLDAGAGLGFLSVFLSAKCKQVIAVEKDPRIAEGLRQQIKGYSNITLIVGDVLEVDLPSFNKVISIPPYYLSSQLLTWLLNLNLDCAVLILQKEFAERLTASLDCDKYGWLTVLTQQTAKVDLFDTIPKWMFYPPPSVDSVIVRLKPWVTPEFTVNDQIFFERMVKWLFTQRNKKIINAISPFIQRELKLDKKKAAEVASALPNREKRARKMAPKDFGVLSNDLSK